MSVNLLGNPLKSVKISDELESFFHVLVDYSVRYLRSNCTLRNTWLKNYFYFCGFPNDLTGGHKSMVIKHYGQLTKLALEGPLLFDSPMDQLLDTLVRSFYAHYKVMHYEALQARSPTPSSSSPSSGSDTHAEARAAFAVEIMAPVPNLENEPGYAAYKARMASYVPPDNTPTEEDRRLASRVADHSFALDFIAKLLRRNDWPDDDRIAQRPAPAPAPAPAPEPLAEPDREEVEPATKRRRKTAPKEKAKPAPPAPPNNAVRRTRSQTRAAAAVQKGPVRRRRA